MFILIEGKLQCNDNIFQDILIGWNETDGDLVSDDADVEDEENSDSYQPDGNASSSLSVIRSSQDASSEQTSSMAISSDVSDVSIGSDIAELPVDMDDGNLLFKCL